MQGKAMARFYANVKQVLAMHRFGALVSKKFDDNNWSPLTDTPIVVLKEIVGRRYSASTTGWANDLLLLLQGNFMQTCIKTELDIAKACYGISVDMEAWFDKAKTSTS